VTTSCHLRALRRDSTPLSTRKQIKSVASVIAESSYRRLPRSIASHHLSAISRKRRCPRILRESRSDAHRCFPRSSTRPFRNRVRGWIGHPYTRTSACCPSPRNVRTDTAGSLPRRRQFIVHRVHIFPTCRAIVCGHRPTLRLAICEVPLPILRHLQGILCRDFRCVLAVCLFPRSYL